MLKCVFWWNLTQDITLKILKKQIKYLNEFLNVKKKLYGLNSDNGQWQCVMSIRIEWNLVKRRV